MTKRKISKSLSLNIENLVTKFFGVKALKRKFSKNIPKFLIQVTF